PHDSLAPSAHGPLRSASQIRSDLARRIFRGALDTLDTLDTLGYVRYILPTGSPGTPGLSFTLSENRAGPLVQIKILSSVNRGARLDRRCRIIRRMRGSG